MIVVSVDVVVDVSVRVGGSLSGCDRSISLSIGAIADSAHPVRQVVTMATECDARLDGRSHEVNMQRHLQFAGHPPALGRSIRPRAFLIEPSRSLKDWSVTGTHWRDLVFPHPSPLYGNTCAISRGQIRPWALGLRCVGCRKRPLLVLSKRPFEVLGW